MTTETTTERIRFVETDVQERLSLSAAKNLATNSSEFYRRLEAGLASSERLNPTDQITRYMNAVSIVSPEVTTITDKLTRDKKLTLNQKLIITIPAVGFGNQEQADLMQTLTLLSQDKLVHSRKATILVLVNRPEGKSPDDTAERALQATDILGINCVVMEQEIPLTLGNTEGSFLDEMALEGNDVPIALIRDILNISAIKLWLKSDRQPIQPPILVQMDADFTGFKQGELTTVLNYFDAYSDLQFLQCTSDWENSQNPVRNNYPLWVGAELMRELPQFVKRNLRNNISKMFIQEIIFGEVIQRGIQVPQAERMESIAKKGGYGLNRMKEDELDSNIRITAISSGVKSIGSTSQVVFNWSSRRAERSWVNYRKPPISQWASPFLADDPVRTGIANEEPNGDTDITLAISRTLERLPYPNSILSLNPNFLQEFFTILQRYKPGMQPKDLVIKETKTGTFLLKLKEEEYEG